ncbi:M15 family metallopeptidase [Shewanella sp. KX20019]|uniref:M15 family metallopeptidase n=1 Tax=Shewanella sp. KX20019 TaxID=2803864 RepID=UPI00192867BB|nr:M15 family metallopeptidase [Shewanella sp. KX20019]QQX82269.1 M15 family metallopeptidase [Shewanella sp. KX20019]
MPIAAPHLYGLSGAHLVEYSSYFLEQQTATAFEKMRVAAAQENIAIEICSAFRDFERQQLIWNAKASGTRALLNKDSQPVGINGKTAVQIVELILLWSALPGTSRHHWGTDIDIFDSNKISKRDLQLIPPEYQVDGPCYELSLWLAKNAQRFGFYFPFQQGLSGVSAEPWHLSYYPVSKHYLDAFDVDTLSEILQGSAVLHKEQVLLRLKELAQEYVFRVAPTPL